MTETAAPPAESPSRRVRTVVVWTVVALVLATFVVAFFLVRSFVGPVVEASGHLAPRPVAGVTYFSVTPLSSDSDQVFAVDANKPGSFGVAFEILNDGRIPVTLDATPPDPGTAIRETTQVSSVPLPGNDFQAGKDIPLDGVRMEPGERRRLVLTYSWTDLCLPEEQEAGASGLSWSFGSPVRYSAFGGLFSREEEIAPPAEVVFVCGPLPKPDGNFITLGEASASP